jgi:RNA polymerase sigma factor (sigma-70 family)
VRSAWYHGLGSSQGQGGVRAIRPAQLVSCYQSFAAPLRAFLVRQTRSTHDAEDLAQEVFLRMWRMGAGSEVRHQRALVYKTANNLLKDRSRRFYTRMMHNAVPAVDVELVDCATEPSGLLESAQTLAAFNTTLAGMRPATRQAFLMYRVEVRSQSQIAAEMRISVSMVEKHISYAMAALREAGIE